MNRLLALLLSLLLALTVLGCTQSQPAPDSSDTQEPQPEEQQPASSTEIAGDAETPSLLWAEGIPALHTQPDWTVDTASETFLLELTDPKYEGRVTGSAGNRAAADWIESQLTELGLQPLPSQGSYRHSFYTQLYELLGGYAAIVSPDGTETELELGVDWLFRASYEEVDLTLPLSADLADCEAGTAFLDAEQTRQESPRKYIEIAVGDVADGMPYTTSRKQAASRVVVTREVYDRLTQPDTRLHLRLPVGVSNGMADNVAGYLPGADSSKLVLIGAHFDGSGQCGILMPSAYDNASGVATMLQTAAWLAQAEELPCDVMCVAFNGEEIGLQGSAALAGQLAPLYDQILVVNIDCVGWRDTPLTVYGEAASATLRNDLAGGMELQYKEEPYSGDQASFSKTNMQAVTITQDASMYDDTVRSVMHSARDTVDNLEPAMLDELAQKLCAWVLERGANGMTTGYPVIW